MMYARVLLLLLLLGFISAQQLSHDEKVDLIAEAYTSLKQVVQTLLDVHTTIQEGALNTNGYIGDLTNSKTRAEYEVNVMHAEHQLLLAQAAKRSEEISPEEAENTQKRGEAIEAARTKVGELGAKIEETTRKTRELNAQMQATTLKAADLERLQTQANEDADPEDHITMPSTADIKTKVDEQLDNIQRVIQSVTDSTVSDQATELKESIASKFLVVLDDDSTESVSELINDLKMIDSDLLQLRGLDIYGSSSKMEL